MKKLFTFILVLFVILTATAATPSFNSFFLSDFLTNGLQIAARNGCARVIRTDGTHTNLFEPNALDQAVAISAGAQSILLFGTFNLSNVVIFTNITVQGVGNPTLRSQRTNLSGCTMVPYGGSTLKDFTIVATDPTASLLIGTDKNAGQPAITNAFLSGVTLIGTLDALYINHSNICSLEAKGCTLTAGTDTLLSSAIGQTLFTVCTFNMCSNAGTRGLGIAAANTNRFVSCTFNLDENTAANSTIISHVVTTSAGAYTELTGCTFLSQATNVGISILGNLTSSKQRVEGSIFRNVGCANTLAATLNNASAVLEVADSLIFPPGDTSTNQFECTSSKGTIFFWGGNVDPFRTAVAKAKVVSGITNLFVAQTNASPSGGWITPIRAVGVYWGGTNAGVIPVYAP